MRFSPKGEEQLITELLDPNLAHHPYKWLRFAFPWGEGELAEFKDMRHWQRDFFEELGYHIRENIQIKAAGGSPKLIKLALRSGHGPGKSAALDGMLTHWYRSVFLGSSIQVFANSKEQLRRMTFPEVGKWVHLAINSHWFHHEGLTVRIASWFEQALKKMKMHTEHGVTTGYLWNEEKPEAVAGLHNWSGVMAILDEASGIPGVIWESIIEGYYSEPTVNRILVAAGNPLHNTGEFADVFEVNRGDWTRLWTINCLEVEGMDHEKMKASIEKYGMDSNRVRTRILGLPPLEEPDQFIARNIINEAVARKVNEDPGAPLIFGGDIAHTGPDKTIGAYRKGYDARSIPWLERKGHDGVEVAHSFANDWGEKEPDGIACDGGGTGSGACDILKRGKWKFDRVAFGNPPIGKEGDQEASRVFADIRTQLWWKMRQWLIDGGAIPNDQELIDELATPKKEIVEGGPKDGCIKLESVRSMVKRGKHSPDKATALALTFFPKVARIDSKHRPRGRPKRNQRLAYNPLKGYTTQRRGKERYRKRARSRKAS